MDATGQDESPPFPDDDSADSDGAVVGTGVGEIGFWLRSMTARPIRLEGVGLDFLVNRAAVPLASGRPAKRLVGTLPRWPVVADPVRLASDFVRVVSDPELAQ